MVLVSKMSSKVLVAVCALSLSTALAHATTATKKTTPKKTAVSSTHAKTSSSTKKSSAKKTSSRGRKSHHASRKRGQQNIDSARAREIQEALIRDGYMQGEASGTWDQTSQQAMEKFQSDNGWQTKVTPDSRALIKLGLGPDHQHLLNPESAMTTAPVAGPSAPKESVGDGMTPPQQ